MPNRNQAPPLKEIQSFSLAKYEVLHLDNGIPVYAINKGTQDIVKIEVVFQAGRWYESHPIASRAAAVLLKEGTQSKTGAEIAEHLDYYGANLRTSGNVDTLSLTLFSIHRHLPEVLPILADILTNPIFPPQELETFVQNQKQKLKVDATKNDVTAFKEITAALFGNHHPYGYNSSVAMYDGLKREHLIQHFESCIHAGHCKIFVSGKINQDILDQLNNTLGQSLVVKEKISKTHQFNPFTKKKMHFKIPNSVQTAIRIGRQIMLRDHEDYLGFVILNTVLGGYFGSRLMNNIREEKGYTYGIYSGMEAFLHAGYFTVSTEVGSEVTEATLTEIYKEFRRLQDELIPIEELSRVKNYMMGILLNSLDGPFNMASLIRSLVLSGMNDQFFNDFIHTIQTITPETLQHLAKKYLNPEDMYEVLVN